ncbi:MAG TPA: family 16 glycoside hydrolase, partial [Phycisphaerae bacterium]|nr:family 16 glycoside hydrolase [Phycisphaerae bacterium]
RIFIALNGIQVQDIDLNQWDTAHKNPDGSKNKFRDPLKKIQHPGFLALQTHGRPVWYRDIRVKPLAALGKCPSCGKEGPEGWYCAKCNTVCTREGQFDCKKEPGKKMTSGTYCPKANRFRFAPDAPTCAKCGKAKGMWCAPCEGYYMTAGVAYCEKCKKPYAKTPAGCPKCGKKEG